MRNQNHADILRVKLGEGISLGVLLRDDKLLMQENRVPSRTSSL